MGTLLTVIALASAIVMLSGLKLAAIFGLVLACATFSFPFGLIGLAGMGVSLLFLLNVRREAD